MTTTRGTTTSDKLEGEAAIIARLANIKYRSEKGEAVSVEDANFWQENKHLLESRGNQSKYDYETYAQDKKNIDFGEPLSKGEFAAAIDQMGKVIESKFVQFDEKFTTMINNSALGVQYRQQQNPETPQTQKQELLKGVMETVVDYLKTSRQSSGPSEFEQELLARSKAEMMESVNIVSLINKKVKGALVSDIAGGVADHIMKSTSAKLEHGF